MQVHLNNPSLEHFIAEEVRAGHFPSIEAAIEAAVERMMRETDSELDDETIAAILRAEQQVENGEGMDFGTFAAQMRQRIAGR